MWCLIGGKWCYVFNSQQKLWERSANGWTRPKADIAESKALRRKKAFSWQSWSKSPRNEAFKVVERPSYLNFSTLSLTYCHSQQTRMLPTIRLLITNIYVPVVLHAPMLVFISRPTTPFNAMWIIGSSMLGSKWGFGEVRKNIWW